MSTTFLLIYIMALISILIGISGFILLIYGLINKKKNMTISGSVMSFIAILLFTTGLFWGARKVSTLVLDNFGKDAKGKMHCPQMEPKCCMHMNDSLANQKDSCCMKKKMECKKSCPHHQ